MIWPCEFIDIAMPRSARETYLRPKLSACDAVSSRVACLGYLRQFVFFLWVALSVRRGGSKGVVLPPHSPRILWLSAPMST